MNRKIRVSRGTLFAVAVAFAGSAFAQAPAPAGDGQWAKSHPRREEVNARLANQKPPRQQGGPRGRDQQGAGRPSCTSRTTRIRMEERAMASTNGGHITKTEQRALNQQ